MHSLAKAVFSHPQLTELVVERGVVLVQDECAKLCRRSYPKCY